MKKNTYKGLGVSMDVTAALMVCHPDYPSLLLANIVLGLSLGGDPHGRQLCPTLRVGGAPGGPYLQNDIGHIYALIKKQKC